MRILILIAIGLLLYVIINNLLKKMRAEKQQAVITEKMVKCAHCGLHVPEQDAIQKSGLSFCSEQHLHDHE